MTQQDALRMAIDRAQRLKLMLLNNAKGRAAFELMQAMAEDNEKFLRDLQEAQSALAEQDDEAVGYVFSSEGAILQEYGICFDKEKAQTIFNHVFQKFDTIDGVTTEIPGTTDGAELIGLYRRPSPKTYTESDIDVAIGVVEWDKLNLFATAEMVKQIVMRFAGSQVTMGVKRLSEDEVPA